MKLNVPRSWICSLVLMFGTAYGADLELDVGCFPPLGKEVCASVSALDLSGTEVGGVQLFLLFTDLDLVEANPGDYDGACHEDPTEPISFEVYECFANEDEPWDCPNMDDWPPDGTGKIGYLASIPFPPNAPTSNDQIVATFRFVVTGVDPRAWWDPIHDPETTGEALVTRLSSPQGDELPLTLTTVSAQCSDVTIESVRGLHAEARDR